MKKITDAMMNEWYMESTLSATDIKMSTGSEWSQLTYDQKRKIYDHYNSKKR